MHNYTCSDNDVTTSTATITSASISKKMSVSQTQRSLPDVVTDTSPVARPYKQTSDISRAENVRRERDEPSFDDESTGRGKRKLDRALEAVEQNKERISKLVQLHGKVTALQEKVEALGRAADSGPSVRHIETRKKGKEITSVERSQNLIPVVCRPLPE